MSRRSRVGPARPCRDSKLRAYPSGQHAPSFATLNPLKIVLHKRLANDRGNRTRHFHVPDRSSTFSSGRICLARYASLRTIYPGMLMSARKMVAVLLAAQPIYASAPGWRPFKSLRSSRDCPTTSSTRGSSSTTKTLRPILDLSPHGPV